MRSYHAEKIKRSCVSTHKRQIKKGFLNVRNVVFRLDVFRDLQAVQWLYTHKGRSKFHCLAQFKETFCTRTCICTDVLIYLEFCIPSK